MKPLRSAYQCAIEYPMNLLRRMSNDHGIKASWNSRMLLGTGDIIVKHPEPWRWLEDRCTCTLLNIATVWLGQCAMNFMPTCLFDLPVITHPATHLIVKETYGCRTEYTED